MSYFDDNEPATKKWVRERENLGSCMVITLSVLITFSIAFIGLNRLQKRVVQLEKKSGITHTNNWVERLIE